MSISHQLVQFGFIVFDTNSSMQTVGMPSSPVAFLARCLPRQLPSSPVAFLYLALPQIIFSLVSTNQNILHLVFATLSASPVSKPCASIPSVCLFVSALICVDQSCPISRPDSHDVGCSSYFLFPSIACLPLCLPASFSVVDLLLLSRIIGLIHCSLPTHNK